MTFGLRRAHKYIWILIAMAIPLIMFFSTKDLDFFYSEGSSLIKTESERHKVLKVAENERIKAQLVVKDASKTLEIILKTTLKNSSSIVFELNGTDQKGEQIGQLTASGIYKFKLRKWPRGILIYDPLKDKLITKLYF